MIIIIILYILYSYVTTVKQKTTAAVVVGWRRVGVVNGVPARTVSRCRLPCYIPCYDRRPCAGYIIIYVYLYICLCRMCVCVCVSEYKVHIGTRVRTYNIIFENARLGMRRRGILFHSLNDLGPSARSKGHCLHRSSCSCRQQMMPIRVSDFYYFLSLYII